MDDGARETNGLRLARFTGPPRFVTREQFMNHKGTPGEVTRNMADYTRGSSLAAQPDGDPDADGKGENPERENAD